MVFRQGCPHKLPVQTVKGPSQSPNTTAPLRCRESAERMITKRRGDKTQFLNNTVNLAETWYADRAAAKNSPSRLSKGLLKIYQMQSEFHNPFMHQHAPYPARTSQVPYDVPSQIAHVQCAPNLPNGAGCDGCMTSERVHVRTSGRRGRMA